MEEMHAVIERLPTLPMLGSKVAETSETKGGIISLGRPERARTSKGKP
jgi:hypothetical protein